MKAPFLALAILGVAAGGSAEETEVGEDPWKPLVNQTITADGLAWGAMEKGLGQRVILDDGLIYLKNPDFLKHKINGKLIRVSGVLRLRRMNAAPPGAQGYARPFSYYALEVINWKLIDTVNDPHPRLVESRGTPPQTKQK